MTNLEAMEILEHKMNTNQGNMKTVTWAKHLEALALAKQALEKQEPKKTVKDFDGEFWDYYCPACKTLVVAEYCYNCGQKLEVDHG